MQDDDRGQCGRQYCCQHSRQQSVNPAGVKARKAEAVRGDPIADQARDQEARNDEKDINTYVATAESRYPQVKEDDRKDSQGAQAINIGEITQFSA